MECYSATEGINFWFIYVLTTCIYHVATTTWMTLTGIMLKERGQEQAKLTDDNISRKVVTSRGTGWLSLLSFWQFITAQVLISKAWDRACQAPHSAGGLLVSLPLCPAPCSLACSLALSASQINKDFFFFFKKVVTSDQNGTWGKFHGWLKHSISHYEWCWHWVYILSKLIKLNI